VREEGGILLAGAVMVGGGYVEATWSWLPAMPLFVAGGFAIAAAGLSGHHPAHKRRVVRAGERYIANPPTKAALRLGLPMPLVLLETTGRRTGKPRRTPLMNGVIGHELWIVAEHGDRAAYVRNLLAVPHVRSRRVADGEKGGPRFSTRMTLWHGRAGSPIRRAVPRRWSGSRCGPSASIR
jgi:deazaflavin-dependent oxidoreductase (nitroreductase family)